MKEIEKGSVIDLELFEKNEDGKYLVFKIGNYEGRLPLEELSNSKELCAKMFSILEIEDNVSVVVIGHNQPENYIELSTRIFRNALDDSVSFFQAKKIIKNQFKARANQEEQFLFENRKMLDRLRGDLSSNELTFLYELIQNAVDHPNKNFDNKVSVKFEIFENFLLLKHNGALFTENNFQSITGILAGEKINETDVRRIGYKGIGFKSVFRYSQNVYVRSGNFSFGFNKALCDAKIGLEKPWEVIPFFQNEIDEIDKIKQFEFFNVPVAFAFEFPSEKAKNDVIEYLKQLASNPYLLIFLENLIKLDIVLPDNFISIEKSVKKDEGLDIISLEQNGEKLSDWIVFSNQYEIKDENIIMELLDENNKSVPSNFRNFRTPTVSIVIPKDDLENLVNLFTYLPLSKTRYGLPYIVNADFIPNLDRTDIIPALEYNYKVAEFVGEELLKAAQLLAQNKKYDFLTKLLPIYDQSNIRFKNVVKEKFIEDSLNYKIFPPHYGDELCTIQELLIDKTGISSILSKEEFKLVTGLTQNPLSSKIKEVGVIEKFIIEIQEEGIYDVENLKRSLTNEDFINWLKTPSNNIKLIKYFYSKEDLKSLLKESIILSSTGELKRASELYLSIPSNATFTNVMLLHSTVSAELTQEEIILNTKTYDSVKFYKNQFLSKNEFKTKESTINFWSWVYDEWEEIKEEKDAINSLKSKNILVEKDKEETVFTKINQAYVSSTYDPNSEVETIIEQVGISVLFISSDLISSNREISLWLKIFKRLGVKTDLQDLIGDLINKLPNIDSQKHLLVGKEVFKYWKKNEKNEQKKLTTNQISVLKKTLKIECIDGDFRKVNEVLLSDHYTTNQPLEKVLPIIKPPHSISPDYDSEKKDINNWSIFFQMILSCKAINEKQMVLEVKVNYLGNNQDNQDIKEKHFEILEELSLAYKNRNNNHLNFQKISFKKIKLQTTQSQWLLPNGIHFSSPYINNEDLDLQEDPSIQDINFLSDKYLPKSISKAVLKRLGVRNSYRIIKMENLNIKNISTLPYYKLFLNTDSFRARKDYLLKRGYQSSKIDEYTNFSNVRTVSYLKYSVKENFNKLFWDFIKKDGIIHITVKTSLINHRTTYATGDNHLVYFFKTNKITPNQKNELKKTLNLYSWKFANFIHDKSLLPLEDLTQIMVGDKNKISLEKAIGINQVLSIDLVLKLLSEEDISLSSKEVDSLEIIKILRGSIIEGDGVYKLPNKDYEWKFTHELFVASNENFVKEIPHEQLLHPQFNSVAGVFNIQMLSEENLSLLTEGQKNVTDEIIEYFNQKGKYLSFKLAGGEISEYEDVLTRLIEKLSQNTFYECDRLVLAFPSESPIFEQEIDYKIENNNIYFEGFWKINDQLISHLLSLINDKNLKEHWFKNFLNRWDEDYIIQNLSDEFGEIPWTNKKKKNPTNKEDLDEIKRELERLGITPSYEIQVDINYSAMLMGWKYLQQNKYDVDNAIFEQGFLSDVKVLGQTINVMIRSGKRGVFFLREFNWTDLEKPEWHLLVKIGSGFNSFNLVQNQQQLLDEFSSDVQYNVLRLSKDIGIETLTEMMNTLTANKKGEGHFIFRTGENSPYKSIFSQIDSTKNKNVPAGLAEEDNF